MAAKLTGNKAQLVNTLAQKTPVNSGTNVQGNMDGMTPADAQSLGGVRINTDVMKQYNPAYNPNVGSGVSGVMGTTPVVDQAKGINTGAEQAGGQFMDGMAGKLGGGTTPAPTSGPTIDYNAERNKLYDAYGKEVGPSAEDQVKIDQARADLEKSYGGPTLEDSYNKMRDEKGISTIEQRLNETNASMRLNEQGKKRAEEQVFGSSGGVTEAGVQQLRAANSRDFIRNLADLSNIRANTIDELNMKNGQIDTVLKLRQQDRADTQKNLLAKIDLLSNKISPAQKELLKMKLDSTIKSLDAKESAEVDRIKKVNEYQMQRDYTLGDIKSTDPLKRRVAVENAVNEVRKQYEGIPFERSSVSMADDIQKLVEGGMSLSDAIKQNIITPMQGKAEYKDYMAKKMGTQDKYDYKPIQSTDANGNLITTGYIAVNKLDPTDYRVLGVDANGMPASTGSGAGAGTGGTTTTGTEMRTDRNRNPTAMTTAAAETGGLVEGVDYERGDSFQGSDGKTYYTARFLKDPIATTIDAIDNMGFKTAKGQNRWSYTDKLGLNNNVWNGMTKEQKTEAVKRMYQMEGGSGAMFGGGATTPITPTTSSTFDPTQADTYKNALAGTYPAGMKAGYANANKLLAEAKAWKESLKGAINDKGYDPDLSSYYLKGTNIEKAELDSLGKTAKQFTKEAQAYIKDYGTERYGKLDWNIDDPKLYSTLIASPEGKKLETEIPTKMSKIDAMNRKFDSLIKLTQENGPEAFTVFSSASKEMEQLYGQILLDAKEALNLGVLQKIDEDVIRRQIPDPTSWGESLTTGFGETARNRLLQRIDNARKSLNGQATDQLKGYGITKIDTSKYK